jgi:hypothetical protein
VVLGELTDFNLHDLNFYMVFSNQDGDEKCLIIGADFRYMKRTPPPFNEEN